jgi:hypothetical protein
MLMTDLIGWSIAADNRVISSQGEVRAFEFTPQ